MKIFQTSVASSSSLVLFFWLLLYLPSLFPFPSHPPPPLLSGWLNYIVRTRHYLQCNQFCLRAANVLIPIHTNKTKRGHLLPAIICPCIGMGVQVTSNYRNSFRRFPVLNARRCGHGTRFLPPDRIISRKDFHSNFRVFFDLDTRETNKLSYGMDAI